ncbi:low-specificity L-threonine aldolase [Bordetella pertussis]|uniref:Low-specificity L-threonine aldolase n=7 Tax=Bordetella TaxID=517 RepID=Q7VW60_BORPE|nr:MULTISPECIES: low-specificity L-threonine aldolase [Bordetella]ETH37848.1 glycine hydroxymethyltransferase [Bordetella pertussis H918]ETH45079.1 glycine hydroxymethyltransferase [Bordetella pertussis H939]ETH46916.1 glycine hydroxymethyltransferase [Bordetella pertussis H921]ETH72313.1 glycine hydroxymethyltransferase [Bordetella pertussis STO1-CHLA-0011]ETH90096.1 glycine hydroxymethyltransferase [Bordetella pertussis STO1-CHOC-0019]ETH98660.1 glycine hydroxymethyltransferase [Bordetella 
MIDLRSDTVTRPSAAMRQAMAAAPVGDDVMGDDPSVRRLQDEVAARAGKEAGLFFPSGTQSNLAALMAHCARGDEYLVGQQAHTYKFEGGGAAVLGSIQPQPVDHAADGSLPLDRLAAALKPGGDPHFARTRLLALENTFQGRVMPAGYVAQATGWAREHGLSTHLDGARVFNAAVASGVPVQQLCEPFDTVSICFSKGLGAPVGSVLVGSRALIEQAHRWRKMLGGGMRQAGILAAACLHALHHHVERLALDHDNAARLAAGLDGIDGVRVLGQHTNMVFAEFDPARCESLTTALRGQGILMRAVYGGPTRLVTHLDVDADGIDRVVDAVRGHCAAAR